MCRCLRSPRTETKRTERRVWPLLPTGHSTVRRRVLQRGPTLLRVCVLCHKRGVLLRRRLLRRDVGVRPWGLSDPMSQRTAQVRPGLLPIRDRLRPGRSEWGCGLQAVCRGRNGLRREVHEPPEQRGQLRCLRQAVSQETEVPQGAVCAQAVSTIGTERTALPVRHEMETP